MQKIVIVGAGPAGLLLAHYLQRGAAPHRALRSPPRSQAGRLIQPAHLPNLAAATRHDGDWRDPWARRPAYRARRLVPGLTDAPQIRRAAKDKPQDAAAADRPQPAGLGLAAIATRNLRRRQRSHSVRLSLHRRRPQGPERHLPASRPSVTTRFDRLVGADGVRSQVRDALVAAGKLQCEQALIPDAYRSLFVRRTSSDKALAEDRVHAWFMGQDTRTVMAPQLDGWLHEPLSFPAIAILWHLSRPQRRSLPTFKRPAQPRTADDP